MSESKWSRYVRGLECFNGAALFHHLITKKTLIVSNRLCDFVENDNIFELPINIKEQLERYNFIVKDRLEDDKLFNKNREHMIELADSGKLIKYYNITEKVNVREALKKLCEEILKVNTNFNGFIIVDFYDSILDDIELFIGKFKFIVNINLNKIDINFNEKLQEFKYKNIGVSFQLDEINQGVMNLLNRMNINEHTYVINLKFQSIHHLKKYEDFICTYSVNLKYSGATYDQKELVSLYNYVEKLRLKNKFINVNWEIPLKRMQNEIEDGHYAVNINYSEELKRIIDNECVKLIDFNSEDKISCKNCGIEAICMYKFTKDKEENKDSLCFLSKYSIMKYINENFRSD